MELNQRNHLVIFEVMKEDGLVSDIRIDRPLLHLNGAVAWDVRVTVTYADPVAAHWQSDLPEYGAAKARLFENLAQHAAEEAERLALIDAHWDVIVYEPTAE